MIIEINGLTYKINDKSLFDNLTMSIKENTITTISGKNNSGKTTLLRLLCEENSYDIKIDEKEKQEYTKEELDKIIQVVFPQKTFFKEEKVIDELLKDSDYLKEEISFVINELKLQGPSSIKTLSPKELIKLQIAKAIVSSNKIVLLDELDKYFTAAEIKELLLLFKDCIEEFNLTFVITSTSLENAIYSDELYIINDGKVVLYGDPFEVLEHDNIVNKAGLRIPFMIDLSVKLKDYELINRIELNKEKMINILWK